MPEKAETVQAFYEGGISGDAFEEGLRYLHPDIEIRPALGGELDFGRYYRGHEEARQLIATLSDGVEGIDVQVEPKEVVDVDGDRIIRVERWHPRGRQGIETEVELTHVYSFRDGLIVGIEGFRDKAEALEAAGLAGDQGGESERSGGSG